MYSFAGSPAPHACIPAKMQDCKLSKAFGFLPWTANQYIGSGYSHTQNRLSAIFFAASRAEC
jgi:hypothetical protein